MNLQPLKISVCAMLFLFFLVSYGSTTFAAGVGRGIMSGRNALLKGKPKAALPNFQAIAQSKPDYINCANLLCIGIWTYLGRTYYELGNNQKALESLKRGKGRHREDRFNQIYLGLAKAQTGQEKEGTAELDAGLKALHAWLEGLNRQRDGDLWDLRGHLRKGLVDTRNLLQADKINWDKVNKDVQWLGVNFEEEAREVLDKKNEYRFRPRPRF